MLFSTWLLLSHSAEVILSKSVHSTWLKLVNSFGRQSDENKQKCKKNRTFSNRMKWNSICSHICRRIIGIVELCYMLLPATIWDDTLATRWNTFQRSKFQRLYWRVWIIRNNNEKRSKKYRQIRESIRLRSTFVSHKPCAIINSHVLIKLANKPVYHCWNEDNQQSYG